MVLTYPVGCCINSIQQLKFKVYFDRNFLLQLIKFLLYYHVLNHVHPKGEISPISFIPLLFKINYSLNLNRFQIDNYETVTFTFIKIIVWYKQKIACFVYLSHIKIRIFEAIIMWKNVYSPTVSGINKKIHLHHCMM